MLSGSVAQAPTALVTFTKRAWFVLVSRFTSEGMPPALRMVVLLAGICAHSPKAPTTLIKTCAWKIKFMPSTRGKKYPQRTKKVNVCLSVGTRPERHIHYSPTSSLTSSSTSSPRIFQHTISYHHHHHHHHQHHHHHHHHHHIIITTTNTTTTISSSPPPPPPSYHHHHH